ncbi:MAG: OB-fold nucleic acid binding domain-containing protein, partial [Thermotogota bacterium]|nr:OB-fold nucleic acid binding domain-containing protein [Thermotogota bacterium]
YLFPRGHASSYALLGYICQYLKVHYPVEFFTCHLRYSDHKKYAAIKQVAEDVYGVRFILPSVNAPKLTFEAQKEAILWPLTALKQVGGKAAQSIIKNAPYTSIEDFHNRIDRRVCNKRVMEHLIVGGAFSSFGNIKEVYNNYSSLRGGKDAEPDWLNSKETLVSTMEGIFGFEIIPLKKLLKKKLKPYGKLDTFESFNRKTSGKKVVVFGRVSRVSKITTKKGDKMAFVSLKGSEGIFKVTFFPEAFHLAKDYLKKDNILIVSGKKNIWNKESSIVLETNRSKSSPGFIYGSWIKKL